MFGECFDFAPVEKGRRFKQYVPPSQQQTISLTPREQAVRLASQVGIEASLLDGIANELVEGAKTGDLRAALHLAVAALQQGKSVEEGPASSMKDFLQGKISVLPLDKRFRLMAAWGGMLKEQPKAPWAGGLGSMMKEKKVPAKQTVEGSFLDFGPAPAQASAYQGPADVDEGKRKKRGKDKAANKSRKQAQQRETHDAEYDEGDDGDYADYRGEYDEAPAKPVPAGAAKSILSDLPIDYEQMKRDAVRREEDARNAASKVLKGLEQTRARVEAGVRASKQSSKAASSKEGERAAVTFGFNSTNPKLRDGGAGSARRSDGQPMDSRGQREDEAGERNREDDEDVFDEDQQHRRRRRERGGSRARGYDTRRASRSRSRYGGRNQKEGDRDYVVYDSRDNHRYERGSTRRDVGRSRDDSRCPNESRGHDRYDRDREPRRSGVDDQDHRAHVHHEDRYERGARGGRYEDRADSRDRSPAPTTQNTRGTRREEGRGSDRDSDRHSGQPPKRSDSPEGMDGKSADSSSRRKKNLMALLGSIRSESPKRKSGVTSIFEQGHAGRHPLPRGSIAQESAAGRAAAKAAPQAAASAGGANAAKPEPETKERKLRQLAFKNGWAEYVDQDTGEHLYKNIFSGEMTKRQPVELTSTITPQANMRRLQWLAGHRTAAMMNDLSMAQQQPMQGGPRM